MNRKQYEIDNLPTQIVIGHQTETGVTSIYFDCTSWLASWPDLVLGVWATQPGGTAAYPAATHMEGDVLVWDVTDSDTAVPGVGTVEIVGITTGKKKLSAIAKTQIMRTTTGTATEPPEGAKAWVDSVMQAANDAETSKSQAATYAQNAAASAEKAEENAKSVTWETLSGKPSTFPPDSHTHTLESLGAASAESVSALKDDKLDKTATAADSSKLGGKAPEYYLNPKNLLDNSDFTNPVNQRGATTAENNFIVDRWYTFNDNQSGGAALTSSGITLSGNGYLQQRLSKGILQKGKPYTVAVYYSDSTVDVGTNGVVIFGNGDFDIVNNVYANGKTISHVVLYEGSYTAETLPPYVPKGYAAELDACRVRFVPLQSSVAYGVVTVNGTFEIFVPLSNSLANDVPLTVTLSGGLWAYTPSGAVLLTATIYRCRSNGITISGTCETSGHMPCCVPDVNGSISADL